VDKTSKLIWEAFNEGRRGGSRKLNVRHPGSPEDRVIFQFTDDTCLRWMEFQELEWVKISIQSLIGKSGGSGYAPTTAFIKAVITNVEENYNEFMRWQKTVDKESLGQPTSFSREPGCQGKTRLPDLFDFVLNTADKIKYPENITLAIELMTRFAFEDIDLDQYGRLPDEDVNKPMFGYESRISKTFQKMIGFDPKPVAVSEPAPAREKPLLITPDNPEGYRPTS